MSTRHLVRPSQDQPWDVTVHSVVPPSVNKVLQQNNTNRSMARLSSYYSSSESGGHHAIFDSNGKVSVWKTMDVYTLHHPSLRNIDLMSISTAGTSNRTTTTRVNNNDELYVYCLDKTTRYLALWILNLATERPSMVSKTPSAKMKLHETMNISAMYAIGSNLFLGTTQGDVVKVTMTARPVVLQAETLNRSSEGVWGYMFPKQRNSPIISFIASVGILYSITQEGSMEAWNMDDGESISVISLLNLIKESNKIDEKEKPNRIEVLESSCNGNASADHRNIDIIFKAQKRIYWMRLKANSSEEEVEIQDIEWLNRFHDNVTFTGLVTAENGTSYASFEYKEGPVTVVALCSSLNSSEKVHEVDLPIQEIPSIVGIGKDIETHGIILITSTGLQVRACWMIQQQHKQQQQQQSSVVLTSDQETNKLAKHLKLAFWQYYQTMQMKLPPSWSIMNNNSNQSFSNYEAAIIITAQELQKEGDSSSSKNPLEWHLSFLKLLHKTGLYKNITDVSRWNLLGIGQELAIHSLVIQSNLVIDDDNLPPPYGSVSKLTELQRDNNNNSKWILLLASILKKAEDYRIEHHVDTYHILSNPQRLWTHRLKNLLLFQLKQLQQEQQSSFSKGEENSSVADAIAQIIKITLQVHQEIHSKSYRNQDIQSLGIGLIRSQLVNDNKLAHSLCLEHGYYEGLCRLHVEFPKEETFLLDSLLLNNNDDSEFQDFGPFIFDWFTRHGRYDKVLKYGKLVPDLFESLLEKDERLHRFRWVHALRKEKYDVASDYLYENTNNSGQQLPKTQWNLSMSKLAAKLHHLRNKKENDGEDDAIMMDDEEEEDGNTRLKQINNKLDLCKCQMALVDNGNDIPLQSSEYLLNLVLQKIDDDVSNNTNFDDIMDIDDVDNNETIIPYCMMGLAIAASNNDKDRVSTVWCKVIQKEMDNKWLPWIRGSKPTREVLLDSTLFGKLWAQVEEQNDINSYTMQYNHNDDGDILVQKMGLNTMDGRELKKLFSTITTIEINNPAC